MSGLTKSGFKMTSGGQAEKTGRRAAEVSDSPVASPKRQACKSSGKAEPRQRGQCPPRQWALQPLRSAVASSVQSAPRRDGGSLQRPHVSVDGAPGRRSSMGSGSQLKAGGSSGLNTTADRQQTQVPSADAPTRRRESQRHPAQLTSDCRKVLKASAGGRALRGHSRLAGLQGTRRRILYCLQPHPV